MSCWAHKYNESLSNLNCPLLFQIVEQAAVIKVDQLHDSRNEPTEGKQYKSPAVDGSEGSSPG